LSSVHASVERRLATLTATGDVTWAPSRRDPGSPDMPPLFFYHVPKTGGLTFFLAMMHAFSRGWPAGRPSRTLGRFDDPLERYRPGPDGRANLPRDTIFAASHHGFGFHERFDVPFALATIVRDPVQRVASANTYACMRADRMPSESEFESFIRRPENIDAIPTQLTGGNSGGDVDENIGMAIEHLETRFEAYVPSNNVGALISTYLGVYGLPNVLMENLNRTLPRYRLDPTPWAEEIRARNAVGWGIYRYVAANPRLPKLPFGNGLNPQTVVIRARERRARTEEESLKFDTGELVRRLEAKPDFWLLPESA
jgi:hypothetical protein